jgi:hypothetical protein
LIISGCLESLYIGEMREEAGGQGEKRDKGDKGDKRIIYGPFPIP